MIVVHCPRCGWSEWRFVEYTGASNVYECCHCGAMMTPEHWDKLAHMERMVQEKTIRLDTVFKVAGLFDGEDSQ